MIAAAIDQDALPPLSTHKRVCRMIVGCARQVEPTLLPAPGFLRVPPF
jgi:hypothetical protein